MKGTIVLEARIILPLIYFLSSYSRFSDIMMAVSDKWLYLGLMRISGWESAVAVHMRHAEYSLNSDWTHSHGAAHFWLQHLALQGRNENVILSYPEKAWPTSQLDWCKVEEVTLDLRPQMRLTLDLNTLNSYALQDQNNE